MNKNKTLATSAGSKPVRRHAAPGKTQVSEKGKRNQIQSKDKTGTGKKTDINSKTSTHTIGDYEVTIQQKKPATPQEVLKKIRVDFVAFYVTDETVRGALEKDALDMCITPQEKSAYYTANSWQYAVAIEMWANLFDLIAPRNTYRRLLWMIHDSGLIGTIKHADKCANTILTNSSVDDPLVKGISEDRFAQLLPDISDTRVLLQLCRFLKRFSPAEAVRLNEAACDEFVALQKRIRNWEDNRCNSPRHIFPSRPNDFVVLGLGANISISAVKNYGRPIDSGWHEDVCTDMVQWIFDSMRSKIEGRYVPEWTAEEWTLLAHKLGSFSNGASIDGKTLEKKVNAWAHTYQHIYGVPLVPKGKGKPFDVKDYTIEVKPVPKSWKSPRLIAPEKAVSNWWLNGARKALYRAADKEHFDAENQDVNRELCEAASRAWYTGRTYASVDHSSASDSIGIYHGRRVFPKGYMQFLERFRAPYYSVPYGQYGKTKVSKLRLQTLLTSGNPLTFLSEGYFFLALAEVATEYAEVFLQKELLDPSVFGDDLLIDEEAFDTYVSFAETLGLVINVDKSFAGGEKVRESCGVEFLEGADTTSVYWPRKEIKKGSAESLESLMALQRKLYHEYPDVATQLAHIIRDVNPSITGTNPNATSVHGPIPTDSVVDLFEPNPKITTTLAPHKGKVDVSEDVFPLVQRELHTVLMGTPQDDFSPLVDAYLYALYLREGPHYEDALSRRLKVSEPISRIGSTAQPQSRFVKKPR